MIIQRLQTQGIPIISRQHIVLQSNLRLVFADDPDIAVYDGDLRHAAVEVKGGIDPAGVLERVGAALKSLGRVKRVYPNVETILILHAVSITEQSRHDLLANAGLIQQMYSMEQLLGDVDRRGEFFGLLGMGDS